MENRDEITYSKETYNKHVQKEVSYCKQQNVKVLGKEFSDSEGKWSKLLD